MTTFTPVPRENSDDVNAGRAAQLLISLRNR